MKWSPQGGRFSEKGGVQYEWRRGERRRLARRILLLFSSNRRSQSQFYRVFPPREVLPKFSLCRLCACLSSPVRRPPGARDSRPGRSSSFLLQTALTRLLFLSESTREYSSSPILCLSLPELSDHTEEEWRGTEGWPVQ